MSPTRSAEIDVSLLVMTRSSTSVYGIEANPTGTSLTEASNAKEYDN